MRFRKRHLAENEKRDDRRGLRHPPWPRSEPRPAEFPPTASLQCMILKGFTAASSKKVPDIEIVAQRQRACCDAILQRRMPRFRPCRELFRWSNQKLRLNLESDSEEIQIVEADVALATFDG